jgi:hypothetical protein
MAHNYEHHMTHKPCGKKTHPKNKGGELERKAIKSQKLAFRERKAHEKSDEDDYIYSLFKH